MNAPGRLMIGLVLLLAVHGVASAQCPAFVGTWSTTYGEMNLQRSGDRVFGTYGDSRIEGRLLGNRLAGRWIYPSGRSGSVSFTLRLPLHRLKAVDSTCD